MVWITAFFTEGFAPKTALSPTVSVLRLSDNTVVVNAAAMTESNLSGYYYYDFAAYDEDEEYTITADGGVTLSNMERYKFGGSAEADIKLIKDDVEIVDGNVDDIKVVTDDLASAENVADVVWDEILTGATHNIPTSSGRRLRQIQEQILYENGSIWIDTVNGTSGTTDFENGTLGLPVDNIADALTLSASLGIKKFSIFNGSTITLGATIDGFVFVGASWNLALGGQNINDSVFIGADVSGIGSYTALPATFVDCVIGTSTLPPSTLKDCSISGTITLDVGDYFLHHCYSAIAGILTPAIDFGAAIGTTDLNMRAYSGGIEIQNMNATDRMSLEGWGQLIINANCSGGIVAIRGAFTITDNSGSVTLSDDARLDVDQVGDAVWEEPAADHTTSTTFGGKVNTMSTNITTLVANIAIVLGLTHENIYSTHTYNGYLHIGSIVEIYDSKTNAELHDGVTGLVASYQLTILYSGINAISHEMVRLV